MTDGGLEPRLAQVERDQARDGQRLSDLERRVDALTPLLTSVVTLTVEFKNLRDEVKGVREDLHGFVARADKREEEAARRDKEAAKDRQNYRRWQIGLAVALFIGLLSAAAVIFSSGGLH